MSDTFVELVEIARILPHPNADRLDVVTIKGTTCCTQKGSFAAGDLAVYFPPDVLLPHYIATKLGVNKYLRSAIFTAGEPSSACRVGACRMRDYPSYGFVVPLNDAKEIALPLDPSGLPSWPGANLNEWFGAKKYVPPPRVQAGDIESDHPWFERYTSIEPFWKHDNAIEDCEPVRITEKIHGTNSRVGILRCDDGPRKMAGSLTTPRKELDANGNRTLYWAPMENERLVAMLEKLYEKCQRSVIVYGEIFGSKVQDLDYGFNGRSGYRVFDIKIDGRYLDWEEVVVNCLAYGVATVPVLYTGLFHKSLVEINTFGPTQVNEAHNIRSGFKDREGVVITPLKERFSDELGGRMILKSVSADYINRRGATDDE